MRPRGAARTAETLGELALHRIEARTQELRVLSHVLVNGIQIGQETRVHELVELVRADEAHLEGVGNFHHVRRAGPEERDARTREGDLGGRRHTQDAVLVTRAMSKMFASLSPSSVRSCTA